MDIENIIKQTAYQDALRKYNDPEIAELFSEISLKIIRNNLGSTAPKSTLGFYITKAALGDNDDMLISATASDTSWDSYAERMTLDLYKNLINRFDETEFISISHYPSLEGRAELGKIERLYIDGEKLKFKGKFYDTDIGRAAFNSIRKDRRDNVPEDNRIRISIGFWDYGHTHGGDRIWKSERTKICPYCALGVKNKSYLDGKLEHAALTRKPANENTEIEDIQ